MAREILFLLMLALSLVVETSLLLVLARTFLKTAFRQLSTTKILLSGLFVTALTIPYVWFIFPYFIRQKMVYLACAEIFAVLTEALLYMFIFRVSFRNCFAVSLLCNTASFLVGFFVQVLIFG